MLFIFKKTTDCSRKKQILMKVGITFLIFDLIHSVHLKILQEPY
jgi:bifunctional ADP-heptose synthase (sugar kinase/adenylyltransferase)